MNLARRVKTLEDSATAVPIERQIAQMRADSEK
jgi:hypothetical protein